MLNNKENTNSKIEYKKASIIITAIGKSIMIIIRSSVVVMVMAATTISRSPIFHHRQIKLAIFSLSL